MSNLFRYLMVAILSFFYVSSVLHGQHVRASFHEIAQRADLIFVGTAQAQTPSWTEHRNMIVTETVFGEVEVIKGGKGSVQKDKDRIALSHMGGHLEGAEVHVTEGVEYEIGKRYLLFVQDDGQKYICPVLCGPWGVYEVLPDEVTGEAFVRASNGKAIMGFRGEDVVKSFKPVMGFRSGAAMFGEALDGNRSTEVPQSAGELGQASASDLEAVDAGTPLTLSAVKAYIQQTALTKPLEKKLIPDAGSVGKFYSVNAAGEVVSEDFPECNFPPPTPMPSIQPGNSSANESGPANSSSQQMMGGPLGACGYQDLNLVMEQVPSGWWEYPINNDCMWMWNQYMNIFTFTASDGTWGSNGDNEFGGYPSSATLMNQWGGNGWGASTLAVCWTSFWCQCCEIDESDVFWNPAFSWTNDFNYALGNYGVWNQKPITMHELGHAWGSQRGPYGESYDYDQPTVMHGGYQDRVEDGLGVHPSDAYLIREQYDNQTGITGITDIAVESYYCSNGMVNSTLGANSYQRGQTMTINNVTVENNSNFGVSNLHVRFYLSSDKNITTGDYEIADYFWTTFGAETYNTGNYSAYIPENAPLGTFYVGMIVTHNGFNGDSYSGNNATFLYNQVTITCQPVAGDTWASATLISLPYTGWGNNLSSNCFQNNEGNSSPDVYYYFQAPACATDVSVSLCGSGFDTKVSLYDNFGNLLASNDDSELCGANSLQSYFYGVAVTPGHYYTIMVEGYGNNQGNFYLDVNYSETVGTGDVHNIFWGGAIPVPSSGGSFSGNTLSANCFNDDNGNGSNDVFYIITTDACAQSMTASLCGSSYDTYLRIAQHDGWFSYNEVAVNDDGCGLQSVISNLPVSPNTTYLITVEGYNTNSGYYTLDVTTTPSPTLSYYLDADADGYGDPASATSSCTPLEGYITEGGDCNDADAGITNVMQDYYYDGDADGYGDIATLISSCNPLEGYVTDGNDCDDTNPNIINANQVFFYDADGDGYGNSLGTITACMQPDGYVTICGDCNDFEATANPGGIESPENPEVDNDCDGIMDNYCDNVGLATFTNTRYSASASYLHFAAVNDAAAYQVSYRAVGTTAWLSKTSQVNSVQFTGLAASTTYEYRIRTKCNGVFTAYAPLSGYPTFTTASASGTCTKPTLGVARALTPTSVRVYWNFMPGTIKYRVRSRVNVTGSAWVVSPANQNQYPTNPEVLIPNLQPGTQYVYQVSSQCSSGWSAYSTLGYFNTPSLPTCETQAPSLATSEAGDTDLGEVAEIMIASPKGSLALQPNPVSDRLFVSLEGIEAAQVHILSLSGSAVRDISPSTLPDGIDVANLPAGIYFIRVTDAQGNILTGRFVKMAP